MYHFLSTTYIPTSFLTFFCFFPAISVPSQLGYLMMLSNRSISHKYLLAKKVAHHTRCAKLPWIMDEKYGRPSPDLLPRLLGCMMYTILTKTIMKIATRRGSFLDGLLDLIFSPEKNGSCRRKLIKTLTLNVFGHLFSSSNSKMFYSCSCLVNSLAHRTFNGGPICWRHLTDLKT